MAFLEQDRLPDYLEPGVFGGPQFNNRKILAFSGRQKTFVNWATPIQSFDPGYSSLFLRDEGTYVLQNVVNLFGAAKGSLNGFRYKNRIDYQIPTGFTADEKQQIGAGDGSTTAFQIYKTYSLNSGSYSRPVWKIVSSTDRAWIDTTELTRTAGTPGAGEYSIDISTGGIVTGDTPAGGQFVYVQCEFDEAVRFERDDIDIRLITADLGAETGAIPRIPLVGLKPTAYIPNQIQMGFLENDRLAVYPSSVDGGLGFKNTIRVTKSGFEKRLEDWLETRGEWTLSFGLADMDDNVESLRKVLDFFYVSLGGARGFRWEDPTDHDLDNEIIGIGDGSTTVFQAVKIYPALGGSETRIITKPQGQLTTLVDDVPAASTTDTTNGQITMGAAPANGLEVKASGPFDTPVEFTSDRIEFSLEADNEFNLAAGISRVGLTEMHPEDAVI